MPTATLIKSDTEQLKDKARIAYRMEATEAFYGIMLKLEARLSTSSYIDFVMSLEGEK